MGLDSKVIDLPVGRTKPLYKEPTGPAFGRPR